MGASGDKALAILAEFSLSGMLATTVNILYAAIGLGLVIFFHELGHFAVAKWCGVFVERFSIGFGPILLSKKKGDTEYALSAIPFGGYVKMLGQDDMDPSQLSSEEIARDTRSYSNKSVAQRMAIISAGVIMNIITGLMFFAVAFKMGVLTSPPIIGSIGAGMPAWTAGLRQGDRIIEINGRKASEFGDIIRGVALTADDVQLKIQRGDDPPLDMSIKPNEDGTRRLIGVGPIRGMRLWDSTDKKALATVPGMSAENADPPFHKGDLVYQVDDTSVKTFDVLQDVLARRRKQDVVIHVVRQTGSEEKPEEENIPIKVAPNRFRVLGLIVDIRQISAIQKESPAEKAGMQINDRIARVQHDGKTLNVGKEFNPLMLPDYFADRAGQDVVVTVIRKSKDGKQAELDISVTPNDDPAWIEQPSTEDAPVAVRSIGIAFGLTTAVLNVVKGSPADGEVFPNDLLQEIELYLPEGAPGEGWGSDDKGEPKTIELGGDNDNWALAFWSLQSAPNRHVRLKVKRDGKEVTVNLEPKQMESLEWYVPMRGIRLLGRANEIKADSIAQAATMGMIHTRNTMVDIYLTLRNLLSGRLSVKNLHGPIGIAKFAYAVADNGLPELLLFLGLISMNLAVLNFLPIPVLDGGHMVFLCWEAVTRKRPSERVQIAATYCGMAFVLGLMLLVIYLDIFVHTAGAQ